MDIIQNLLIKYNIPWKEIERYNEPHRYYHTLNHIKKMFEYAIGFGYADDDELLLAIIFHDIIYDPKSKNNEDDSARLSYQYLKNDKISQAIRETKEHKPTSELSKKLCDLDLHELFIDYKLFLENYQLIFKEYQYLDYNKYIAHHVDLLLNLGVKKDWINAIKYRKPNIGLYPGSFNPFHIGHYNILQKAEQIFDKVIVARGINTDKSNDVSMFYDFPTQLAYRQQAYYSGLLTDYVKSLNYDVTVIRGLRNMTDLQYELNQYRYLQDLMPDIKVVNIFCDKEYEHISSSAIRALEKTNNPDNYKKYLL